MTTPNYQRSGLAAAALRRRGNPRAIGNNQQLLTFPNGMMGYRPPRAVAPGPVMDNNRGPLQPINTGRIGTRPAAAGVIGLLAEAARRRLAQQQRPRRTLPGSNLSFRGGVLNPRPNLNR